MTRRLMLAILATTVATLAVAGLGTLALARAAGRADTERELRGQATDLTVALADLADRPAGERPAATVAAFGRALDLEGIAAVYLRPTGRLVGELPAGVTSSDLSTERLRAGDVVSGHDGDLVYAAAPRESGRGTLVAVVTRRADAGLGSAARWFVVAALGSIAVAALVAFTLARRLARPIREVDDAARAIASGELSTRLPTPPDDARDEIAELLRSVNTMAVELDRSRHLEQQFLLSVSHDLRTPLTSIRRDFSRSGRGIPSK